MDPKLLEILVCPVTKGPLTYDRQKQELISKSARLAYPDPRWHSGDARGRGAQARTVRVRVSEPAEGKARSARRRASDQTPTTRRRWIRARAEVAKRARRARVGREPRAPGAPSSRPRASAVRDDVHGAHPRALRIDPPAGKAARRHRGQADGRAGRRACATRGRHASSWSPPTIARIKAAVEAHGIDACLTRADHPTGTDRLAEAARTLGLPAEIDRRQRAGRRAAARTRC